VAAGVTAEAAMAATGEVAATWEVGMILGEVLSRQQNTK
jgi:hypothetical protein